MVVTCVGDASVVVDIVVVHASVVDVYTGVDVDPGVVQGTLPYWTVLLMQIA